MDKQKWIEEQEENFTKLKCKERKKLFAIAVRMAASAMEEVAINYDDSFEECKDILHREAVADLEKTAEK